MFGKFEIDGILIAKDPIHHGGDEKTGAFILLNRMRVAETVIKDTPEGKVVVTKTKKIPYISGNAVKGVLRRLIMADFLHQIDYAINVETKTGLMLYHSLFAGGTLQTTDAKSSGVIDIGLKKKIRELLPPVDLFGMSYKNQTIKGRLKVGQMYPVCLEMNHRLPVKSEDSIHKFLDVRYQTRKKEIDDELEEQSEEEKKGKKGRKENPIQMKITFEVFVPGTVFYHKFQIEDPTSLHISCLARCIELWKMKPIIGGKSSTGFGELEIHYNGEEKLSSEEYLTFLKENREKIVELLDELSS